MSTQVQDRFRLDVTHRDKGAGPTPERVPNHGSRNRLTQAETSVCGIKQPESLMSARVQIGGRLRRAVTSSSFSGASHEGLQAKDLVARMLLTINAAKPKSQYQAFSSTWACRQFHVAISRSLCRLSRLPSYAHTGRLAGNLPGQPSSSGSNCHTARLPATTRSVNAGSDPVRVPGQCALRAHCPQGEGERATHCSGFCRPRLSGDRVNPSGSDIRNPSTSA